MAALMRGIEKNSDDIRHQVHEDEPDCRTQHDALHHRVIPVEHRIDNQLAEAGNGEDLFGEDGAREQFAKQQRRQRDDRQKRIAEGVAEHHFTG